MSLKDLASSGPSHGAMVGPTREAPMVPFLQKSFIVDSKEFPIFGGESVSPLSFILLESPYYTEEEDVYVQHRIALSRGAIKIHFDNFIMNKTGIKVFLDYITAVNKQMINSGRWNQELFQRKEEEKYYLAPMKYYQHMRNHLWKKKIVALECEYRKDCLLKCRKPKMEELTQKCNLFKSRMIVCERFVCLKAYGRPGNDYMSWEDNAPFSIICSPVLINIWKNKNINENSESVTGIISSSKDPIIVLKPISFSPSEKGHASFHPFEESLEDEGGSVEHVQKYIRVDEKEEGNKKRKNQLTKKLPSESVSTEEEEKKLKVSMKVTVDLTEEGNVSRTVTKYNSVAKSRNYLLKGYVPRYDCYKHEIKDKLQQQKEHNMEELRGIKEEMIYDTGHGISGYDEEEEDSKPSAKKNKK